MSDTIHDVCRLLEICNTGRGDCTKASLPTCSGPSVDLIRHLLDHLHLSLHLCIIDDVLTTPFKEWNMVCFPQFSAMSVCGGVLALYFCWHVNVHVLLL